LKPAANAYRISPTYSGSHDQFHDIDPLDV